MEFTCSSCGGIHDISKISFGANAPVQWDLLSESEREKSELTPEQCVIQADGRTAYFVRACLEVPIKGRDERFTWGVWVSLSEKSFLEMADHWDDPKREGLGPYFGWLCTRIPRYPDSIFLKTSVHQRPVGLRPVVELESTEHPLAVDQREGIDPERMQEILKGMMHSMD